MPRRGLRNLLPFFRTLPSGAKIVDTTGKGETVSDEIQLTYQVEDLAFRGWQFAAVSAFEFGVPGRMGMIEIECRTPKGLVIEQVSGHLAPLAGGAPSQNELRVWTGEEPFDFGGTDSVPEIHLFSPGPRSRIQAGLRSGTVAQGLVLSPFATAFRFTIPTSPGYLNGFWLEEGRFIFSAYPPSTNSFAGFAWHELQG